LLLIRRRFSIDPCVACATATRPSTPQPPPDAQAEPCTGLEIAAATTPPISKKLPPVAAAPIRKKRVSTWAPTLETSATKSKLAQAKLRQYWLSTQRFVSRGETAMRDDTMLARRFQSAVRDVVCIN
jgi:hypothetical protein